MTPRTHRTRPRAPRHLPLALLAVLALVARPTWALNYDVPYNFLSFFLTESIGYAGVARFSSVASQAAVTPRQTLEQEPRAMQGAGSSRIEQQQQEEEEPLSPEELMGGDVEGAPEQEAQPGLLSAPSGAEQAEEAEIAEPEDAEEMDPEGEVEVEGVRPFSSALRAARAWLSEEQQQELARLRREQAPQQEQEQGQRGRRLREQHMRRIRDWMRESQEQLARESTDGEEGPTADARKGRSLLAAPAAAVSGFRGMDSIGMNSSGTALYRKFKGLVDPPDVGGCVGGGYVVQPVNLAVTVFNSAGKVLAGPTPTEQFLGLNPYQDAQGNFNDILSAGSCVYDKGTGRFFMTFSWARGKNLSPWDKFKQGALGAGIAVAVSKAKDPRQPWNVFFIKTTNLGGFSHQDTAAPLNYKFPPFFGDYPQVGVDKFGVYVTTNQFSTGGPQQAFVGQNIYAMSKNALVGAKDFDTLRIAIPASTYSQGVIQPMRSTADLRTRFDGRFGGTMMFGNILPYDANFKTSKKFTVGVWSLTNTRALVTRNFAAVNLHVTGAQVPAFKFAPKAVVQRRGALPLARRLKKTFPLQLLTNADPNTNILPSSVASVAGNLVIAYTVGYGQSNSAVAVAKIKTPWGFDKSKRLIMRAALGRYRSIAVGGQNTFFPAISFNGKGTGVLAMALSGTKFFPSGAFVVLNAFLTPKGRVTVSAPGKLPLESSAGYKRATAANRGTRYGNFQTVTMDERGQAWGFVEYVSGTRKWPTSSKWTNWATYIFKVVI